MLRMALAGGVNIILEAGSRAMFAAGNMLSGEARCKTFDAAADGYVRGEGCGIVVLKRLLRGSQRRPHPGRDSRHGHQPGRPQQRPDRAEWASAGAGHPARFANGRLKPEQIGYVEAHGTGTPSAIRSRSGR